MDENKYLSLKNASQIYGYTRDHLGLMIRQGKLNGVKLGSYYVTTNEWMVSYLKRYANPGHPAVKNKLSNKFSTQAFAAKENTASVSNDIKKAPSTTSPPGIQNKSENNFFSEIQKDILSSLKELSAAKKETNEVLPAVFKKNYTISDNSYIILPVRKMGESEREKIIGKISTCNNPDSE